MEKSSRWICGDIGDGQLAVLLNQKEVSVSAKNVIAMAALAMLLLVGCGGEPAIEGIDLALDNQGAAGDVTQTIKPTDNPFHAVVHVNNGSGMKVKADLVAVDAGGEKNFMVASKELNLSGIENQMDVTFSLPTSWPPGKYKIDAYLNGKLGKSHEFEVK